MVLELCESAFNNMVMVIYFRQGLIEPPKAARGHVTAWTAKCKVLLNLEIKPAQLHTCQLRTLDRHGGSF